MRREAKPILCYVTDRLTLPALRQPEGSGREGLALPAVNPGESGGELLQVLRRAAAAGVDWIQVREKDLPTRALVELARAAVSEVGGSDARVLVNDRLDVALAAGAAGVHLGRESLPAAAVTRWCGTAGHAPQGFLVGVSCHSLGEAQQAEDDGAHYVLFGPVFATPSKAAYGPPLGLDRLAEVCRAVHIPVLAIGGVKLENATTCLNAGAAGIAAIRLFQQAADLPAVVAQLRLAL